MEQVFLIEAVEGSWAEFPSHSVKHHIKFHCCIEAGSFVEVKHTLQRRESSGLWHNLFFSPKGSIISSNFVLTAQHCAWDDRKLILNIECHSLFPWRYIPVTSFVLLRSTWDKGFGCGWGGDWSSWRRQPWIVRHVHLWLWFCTSETCPRHRVRWRH